MAKGKYGREFPITDLDGSWVVIRNAGFQTTQQAESLPTTVQISVPTHTGRMNVEFTPEDARKAAAALQHYAALASEARVELAGTS